VVNNIILFLFLFIFKILNNILLFLNEWDMWCFYGLRISLKGSSPLTGDLSSSIGLERILFPRIHSARVENF
jgi:hypothetical protein